MSGGGSGRRRRLRVLMASDFFLPDAGGVECHVYALSQALLARGHSVTVLTRARGGRRGVRWMTGGLKVHTRTRRRADAATLGLSPSEHVGLRVTR